MLNDFRWRSNRRIEKSPPNSVIGGLSETLTRAISVSGGTERWPDRFEENMGCGQGETANIERPFLRSFAAK